MLIKHVNTMPSREVTPGQVLLFVPNLIGYSRIIFALSSLAVMKYHPKVCTALYCVSCLLDALDGQAARKLNQTSQFGAILDMVTDRCTTALLCCYLCVTYPSYVIAFQLLISLDLASHYMHMYATLSTGSTSHKKVGGRSRLLKLYYSNNKVLFIVCGANELFYVGLYLSSFSLRSPPRLGYLYGYPLSYATLITAGTFPLWALKQLLNIIQMVHAGQILAQSDADQKNLKKQ